MKFSTVSLTLVITSNFILEVANDFQQRNRYATNEY